MLTQKNYQHTTLILSDFLAQVPQTRLL